MQASYDPLFAIAESEATGETAVILADIRDTMGLPLVTSIWRSLAGIDGGLRATWAASKPLYASGQPAAALLRLRSRMSWPVPSRLEPGDLAAAGVEEADLSVVRALVEAYDRSNGLNLLALTGLIAAPEGDVPADRVPPTPHWPPMPPVPARDDVRPETWTAVLRLNRLGATPDEPGLATLWRHLAYWPGLLTVADEAMSPLQDDGTIERSIREVLAIAGMEGARLARLRPAEVDLPADARSLVERYVTHPGLVARMVAVGHGLAAWLQTVEPGRDGSGA